MDLARLKRLSWAAKIALAVATAAQVWRWWYASNHDGNTMVEGTMAWLIAFSLLCIWQSDRK
jgi:hypothetical protein